MGGVSNVVDEPKIDVRTLNPKLDIGSDNGIPNDDFLKPLIVFDEVPPQSSRGWPHLLEWPFVVGGFDVVTVGEDPSAVLPSDTATLDLKAIHAGGAHEDEVDL